MFANIQNGQIVNKSFILQKKTKLCSSFLNILWNEGYILGYKVEKHFFKIFLKKNFTPGSINFGLFKLSDLNIDLFKLYLFAK